MARQRNSDSFGEDMDLPTCSICHNVLEENVCITPCGHRFCRGCISPWLSSNSNCPSCRKTMTARQLIPDRDITDIVKRIKEMQSLINAAGPTTNMADMASDSPLWSQNVEHTKMLLQYKEGVIGRQKTQIESKDLEIQQLKAEVDRLKASIVSLPTLKEQIRQLENQVRTEKSTNSQLQVKLQDATTKDSASKTAIGMLKKYKTDFDRKEINYIQTIQKSSDDLGHFTIENERLTSEMSKLEDELQCERIKMERTKEENEALKAHLPIAQKAINDLSVELKQTKNQAMFVWNRMKQLEMYKQYCLEKDQVLHELGGNILPQRNHTIEALQTQVARLEDKLAIISRDTIPISEHTAKIEAEVNQTKNNLQKSYEEARDKAKAVEERYRNEWQKWLTDNAQSQLKSQNEMNELSTLTPSYKKLVQQNIELQDTVRNLKQNLRQPQYSPTHSTDAAEWLDREN